ncbi:MAG: putative transposase [Acidimicrobiales bacterium]
MVVSMTDLRAGRPLPLLPAGSIQIGEVAAICEDQDGGMAFIWGMACCSWGAEDVCGRRLAAVQLVEIGAGKPGEVARAFGVAYSTLWHWRDIYTSGGVEGLAAIPKGPKGPSKLTGDKLAEIAALRAGGETVAETARLTGLSPRSVAGIANKLAPARACDTASSELVVLARPAPRVQERQAARAGALSGAEVLFTPGASLPLAGSLVVLPALVSSGLLAGSEKVFGTARAAFYSAVQLVLSFALATLLGQGRAERAGRIDPASMGRLLGLDRGPVAETLRRRFAELASRCLSGELWGQLAAHHLERDGLPAGIVYLDGHVRAYHGKADLPKTHLARMRIAMAGTEDLWATDALGEAVLVWTPEPGVGLARELRRAVKEMRSAAGGDAPLTVVFDRGGWSPKLFSELAAEGIDLLTYRKSPKTPEPRSSFVAYDVHDQWGHGESYLLSERAIRLPYDAGRHYFSCRQITRLDERTGHQTQIITTRRDEGPARLAQAMFARWSEENFFKYGRRRFELDGLDSYAKVSDDPERLVPNPAKRDAAAKVKAAKAELALAESRHGRAALTGVTVDAELAAAFAAAHEHLEQLIAAAKAVPARVRLGTLHPEAARLDPERKRLLDAIRISAYNAETALARMLGPHYPRAEDEARALLQETYAASADMEVQGQHLVVRIEPLSAPRRSRALAALCEDLTATETLYPGTELTVIYEVKSR